MRIDSLTLSRLAVTECLDDELRARVTENDSVKFTSLIERLEALHNETSTSRRWSDTRDAARCLKVACSAHSTLRVVDIERALGLGESFARHCLGIDDGCAQDWCVATLSVIDRYRNDIEGARCDWVPMFDCVETFIRGDATTYSGYGSSSSSRLRYMKLVWKCRRFFPDGSARLIWERLADACSTVKENSSFEALGMLHLFTPCMNIAKGGDDAAFFAHMLGGEWLSLSRAMGTNNFWMSAWVSMFSQLSKHDVGRVVSWRDVYGDVMSVAVRFLELPMGGMEGRCSFGRKMTMRAAMMFDSLREPQRRVRVAAKFLIYRAMEDEIMVKHVSNIVDYIEHFYHPSNSGSFSGNLAAFLRFLIKYVSKFMGYGDRTTDEATLRNLVTTLKRMTDRAVFSKGSELRRVAMVGISRLAYICPEMILPGVMNRFEEALTHETATRQLVPALNCLTVCVRPMLMLPLNTVFEEHDGESYANVNDFLAAAMDAALPGIDVNDSSKTCATLRFFCLVISNLPRLVDIGESGAVSKVPIMWSEWTVQFLTKLFSVFEHLQPDAHGSKSEAADAFKGGNRDASGFLLSSSSMFPPLIHLLFARLDPPVRKMAVSRVCAFLRENTLPEIVDEVSVLLEAVLVSEPEQAIREIIHPSITALEEDLTSSSLSTTADARIRWFSGLLGTGIRYARREIAVEVCEDVKRLVRRIFTLGEQSGNLDLLCVGEHLLTELITGMLSFYIVDDDTDDVEGDSITNWVNSKWIVDVNGDVVGDQVLPGTFTWTAPNESSISATHAIIDEFLVSPANEIIESASEDRMECDDEVSKGHVRRIVSSITGVVVGLRERLKDFSDSDATLFTGHTACFNDSGPRGLAAEALAACIRKTSSDDTETLSLICVATESVLNCALRGYQYSRSSLMSLNSIASYVTQPPCAGTKARYPRWFIASKIRLGAYWRNAQSVYYSGSTSSFYSIGPSSDSRRGNLLRALQDMALSKYASVRQCALPVAEALFDRFSGDAIPFIDRSIEAIVQEYEDEDRCIASCAVLRTPSCLHLALSDERLFVSLVQAILGSSHHGTERAQNAIGSVFLTFALMFTRGVFEPAPSQSVVDLKDSLLASLQSRTAMHWSYAMMTNAMTIFFIDTRDDANFLSRATEEFMARILGDLKVVRFPAMCALLMMNRHECFESSCAPVVARVISETPSLCQTIVQSFAVAHSAQDAGEQRGRANGKADALMHAAEALYGYANEMSGPEWPSSRAFEGLPLTGAFIIAVARFWMLIAKISPQKIALGLRNICANASEESDRSTRCAIAEALAGAIASRALNEDDKVCLEDAFLKFAIDASADQREEWLRGAAFCTNSGGGNVSDSLLRRLGALHFSTVSHLSRSIELTRICIAQIGFGKSDIKSLLIQNLADPVKSFLVHESRLVRENGAQLAATLLAMDEDDMRVQYETLLNMFAQDVHGLTDKALMSDPAFPDAVNTPAKNALEGIFYSLHAIVRHGDANVVSNRASTILRSALRTAESKDKDFAMLAKLTSAYLKYVQFGDDELRMLTEMLALTSEDENWHTRAAALRFTQAFTYHHAFTLSPECFATLREVVKRRLCDKQLEVAQLASGTLMIFLKGIGSTDEPMLRSEFLKIASVRLPRGASANEISQKHAAVLGLSACVLSNPYEVPSWMPSVMEALGFASLEPAPIKETTQRTFAEFKKTHQDTWTQTRAAFTHEQWENVTLGLDLAPSYII